MEVLLALLDRKQSTEQTNFAETMQELLEWVIDLDMSDVLQVCTSIMDVAMTKWRI